MQGVAAATLQGWAMPALGMPWWDHTYVESSCGLRWGCFGRDSGGSAGLSSGIGSSTIAHCLSEPNSTAGLRNRRTGVCHQAANRILHPAGVTVFGCRGYGASTFRYNVYGKDNNNWAQKLALCYNPIATMPSQAAGGPPMPQSRNVLERIRVYNRKVTAAYTQGETMESTRMAELSALAEMALGEPLDRETLAALFAIQSDLQRAESGLEAKFDAGEMTPDQYLQRTDAEFLVAMKRSQELLGHERFRVIFGDEALRPEGMTDRDAFMKDIAGKRER